ncbi:MAG: DUF1549 domain-containing protein [Planctomycetota bacterium]|nr:MAG: DUF1549 domain-containing protein [Planctomycetota bacterium]REK30374.1 MAG: DUF1549 domain-containing protein [Planctomycetota bacterium]
MHQQTGNTMLFNPSQRRIRSALPTGRGCRFSLTMILSVCAALGGPESAAKADDSLAPKIDALIDAAHDGPAAPPATDAEFLRRTCLDFAGRIPTAQETRSFLADENPQKRTALIDQLLNSPEFSHRMTDAMHVMLMERMGDNEEWKAFLQNSFAQNRPWNEIVRDILHPDAENEQTRGSAFFLTKRLEKYGQNPVDLPGLTRDVGRLFLGVDLQCAQCHDHLFVDDYTQADFQGLYTFISHTAIRQDTDFPAIAEKLVTAKTEFMSVFTQEPQSTGPRLPGGEEVELATFAEGEEYLQPPDRNTNFPGIPRFSPLTILSEQLPTAENAAFCRNSVNRFWFLLMGRGLVEPLDLHHTENPPSHPELLDLLAHEFAAQNFDVKWLLGQLARTKTYQRSSRLSDADKVPLDNYRVALERPLSAEQLLAGMLIATGRRSQATADESTGDASNEENDPFAQELKAFREAFAAVPREPEHEFAPSVKAALFLLNDPLVLSWLEPKPGSTVATAAALDDAAAAEFIYLTVLSRNPTDEEKQEVVDLLSGSGDARADTIRHLVWALLASTEFCLNH